LKLVVGKGLEGVEQCVEFLPVRSDHLGVPIEGDVLLRSSLFIATE